MQRIVLTLFICGISTSPQCSAQAAIPREYLFVAFSMGSNQYWAGRVYDVCLLYDGSTRRLTKSGFYGEAVNRTCDPWFTRHRFIPYTTAAWNFSKVAAETTLLQINLVAAAFSKIVNLN